MKLLPWSLLAPLALMTGCSATKPSLPLASAAPPRPDRVLVWVGRGEGYSFTKDGKPQRAETQDYDFSVIQRRYGSYWESVKEMHRRHPDYDGSAGPRDQTHFFRVDYAREGTAAPFKLRSTFGDGDGETDAEFRETKLRIRADVSSFAPFDTYRLAQHYRYEEGRLDETVELLKSKENQLYFRSEEHAELFAPQKLLATLPVGSR
jgi:hypothetical protein